MHCSIIVLVTVILAACSDGAPRAPAHASRVDTVPQTAIPPAPSARPFESVPPYAARPAGPLPAVVLGAPPRRDSVVYPLSADLDLLDPVIIGDACEGDGCIWSYRAVVCQDAQLHAKDSEYDVFVDSVRKGDTVLVDHQNLYVHAGAVVLRRDTLGWVRGDTLLLLRRYQPGAWQWWESEVAWSGTEFWAAARDDRKAPVAELVRLPVTRVWLRVVPAHGAPGWWSCGQPGDIRPLASGPEPGASCVPSSAN